MLNRRHHSQTSRWLNSTSLSLFVVLLLSGCMAPLSLQHSIVAYDHAVTNTLTEQLLLNIARAHNHQAIHFTGVSNIAATFDFRVNAGATPPLGGITGGGNLSPIFGVSVAENPTISIIPIEGEDFTKRLLTPFQETKLTLLLRQGVDIDLLLRLMAAELRVPKKGSSEVVYYNRPHVKDGYTIFRQVVLHLSTLQDRNLLYVEPLIFYKTWEIPIGSVSGQDFEILENKYDISVDSQRQLYLLKKRILGRTLITNYDPENLSNEERIQLNGTADRWPPNDLSIDIRQDFPGGEYPIQGNFRLRSFHAILNFLGRSIHDELEYHVDKDPRTPPVLENPVRTLGILESETSSTDATLMVKYNDHHYFVTDGTDDTWNREAFRLLYQLFQMTVSEVSRVGAPSITIAK